MVGIAALRIIVFFFWSPHYSLSNEKQLKLCHFIVNNYLIIYSVPAPIKGALQKYPHLLLATKVV